MYFHTDDPATIAFIAAVAKAANENGQSMRIDVDHKGALRISRGGSMWTAPFESTTGPHRSPVEDLPMGGCATSSAHEEHLASGSRMCENEA